MTLEKALSGGPPLTASDLRALTGLPRRTISGAATLAGINPCQRCPVPPRDPDTGEILAGFQKRFSDRRRETLPAWAEASRFDHFYRFTVNTVAPGFGRML